MKLRKFHTRGPHRGVWLHRDAPASVDAGTWCLAVTGDPLLTRRARACAEYGHVLTNGYQAGTALYGGLVRHAALAEQLDKGSTEVVAGVVDRLSGRGLLDAADWAGIALAGSYRLAAQVISLELGGPAAWDLGGDRAVATGTDQRDADRRRSVYGALNTTCAKVSAIELEIWDGYAVVSVTGAVLAIRAGLSASEVTFEVLADLPSLRVMAALNGHDGNLQLVAA